MKAGRGREGAGRGGSAGTREPARGCAGHPPANSPRPANFAKQVQDPTPAAAEPPAVGSDPDLLSALRKMLAAGQANTQIYVGAKSLTEHDREAMAAAKAAGREDFKLCRCEACRTKWPQAYRV